MKHSLRLLALVAVLGGPGPAFAASGPLIDAARSYIQKHEYKAAVIELKNYLQENPNDAEARMMVGEVYMKLGDGSAAAQSFEKARELKVPKERWIVLLGRSYLMNNDLKMLMERVKPDEDLPNGVRAQVYGLHGVAYLSQGNIDKAQASFDAALKLEPSSSEALLGLALLVAQHGDYKKTIEYAERVLVGDPKNGNAHIIIGEAKRLQGDNQGAVDAFGQGLDSLPNDLRARLGRATAYLSLNKIAEANKDIAEVRKLAPKHPMGLYLAAVVDFQNGKLQEANELLGKAANLMPEHLPTKLLLGTIAFQQGNYEMAESQLGQFVAKLPDNLPAVKLLAATRMKRGRPQEAIQVLKPVEDKAKDDAQFLSLLGSAYLQAKDYEQSNEYLGRAAALDPKAGAIKAQIALGQLAAGKLDEAVTDLKAAVNLDQNLLQADVMLVLALIQQKKYDEAVASANQLHDKMKDDPLPFNLVGAAYYSKGDEAKAVEAWRAALKLKPDYAPAALNLAKVELSHNNVEGAVKVYQTLLEHDPKSVSVLIGLAQIEENRKNYDKMEKYLNDAKEKNPKSPQVAVLLSRLYLQQGKPLRALDTARDAASNTPDDVEVIHNLGMVQLANDQAATAVGSFRKLVARAPDRPQFRHELAQALYRAGDKSSAIQEWRGMTTDTPDFIPAYISLADYYIQEGKFDDALKLAAELKAKQPKATTGVQLEADIEFARKQYRKALEGYGAAYKTAPSAIVVRRMYQAHTLLGEQPAGFEVLNQWLKANPKDVETWMLLGMGYQEAGKVKEAVAAYEKSYELRSDNPVILNNLIWLYQEVGDARALPLSEKLLAATENNPEIMDTVGWVYMQNGKLDKAIALLQDAAVHAPQHPLIRIHLAEAMVKQGRKEEARQQLQRLLTENKDFPERAQAQALLQSL
ncbi:XrtA/PEP-CTERM system TPR-repeat protein PrsT [Methylomagnum ishizawai]|uniref:XrtA/PEP-CTERM system TPR-repeat protein PrsT n=1 Tax=Methylomagnum ishizawai TaxID=1760988 RepID=UPI001C3435BF|nr:XrtA/PEP-CTERM system TPR-repeat protein PrsT [Methylomagnum ishizawai]BBL76339.1 lipoprotein [Methylomagnum ishizawai]